MPFQIFNFYFCEQENLIDYLEMLLQCYKVIGEFQMFASSYEEEDIYLRIAAER